MTPDLPLIETDHACACGEHDAAHPELDARTLGLSIATFRYVPPGAPREEAYLNRLNADLLERLQRGGEVFLSHAVVAGRYLLRACIVNFRTRAGDIDAIPEIVARAGRALDRERRQTTG